MPALKLAATIGLLAIMVFNWIGYQGVTHYLQQKADAEVQHQIDAGDFTTESLLELEVPLNLPYTTDWVDWENVAGDIEIAGQHYRYVQRKIENGHLYVRCLPHTQKQQVLNAREAFMQLAYNLQKEGAGSNQKAPVYVSNYIGDYDDFAGWPNFRCAITPFSKAYSLAKTKPATPGFCITKTEPPEACGFFNFERL